MKLEVEIPTEAIRAAVERVATDIVNQDRFQRSSETEIARLLRRAVIDHLATVDWKELVREICGRVLRETIEETLIRQIKSQVTKTVKSMKEQGQLFGERR